MTLASLEPGGQPAIAQSPEHPGGGREPAARFDLTVVVPTRNERDNVAPLLRRLEAVRPELGLEVLFVDDSSDGTPEVIREEAAHSRRSVCVVHRPEDQRPGGLGGAVKLGMLVAASDLVCVMDGDLQHPPEVLGALIDELRSSHADLVVASRYCHGGEVGDFSPARVALSRACAFAAKAMFPRRLGGITDPMSGFFLVRRSAVDAAALRPTGFKILLEILASGRVLTTTEVPFRFGDRHAGDSKASVREGAQYFRRLVQLRTSRRPPRLAGA
jgi:dolichol-phosphate mannosyltransferase